MLWCVLCNLSLLTRYMFSFPQWSIIAPTPCGSQHISSSLKSFPKLWNHGRVGMPSLWCFSTGSSTKRIGYRHRNPNTKKLFLSIELRQEPHTTIAQSWYNQTFNPIRPQQFSKHDDATWCLALNCPLWMPRCPHGFTSARGQLTLSLQFLAIP